MEVPAVVFQDSEFEKACKELDQPDYEGYEFFTESHDVKIYRQYIEESGLYQYKIYGFLSDVSPEVCAKVYMDIDFRKKWDSYAKELEEIDAGGQKGIYWQVNFPFPMSNRDTYVREMRQLEVDGRPVWVVKAEGRPFDRFPPRSGVVRVTEYKQSAALTSDGKNGTKAFMHYYDNPGGSIPTWLINWVAGTGVPGFLSQMQKACRGYDQYLQSKAQS